MWSLTKSQLFKHETLCLGVVDANIGETALLQDCNEENSYQVSHNTEL